MTKECNVYAKTVCKTKFFLKSGTESEGQGSYFCFNGRPSCALQRTPSDTKTMLCNHISFRLDALLFSSNRSSLRHCALLYMHIQKQQLCEILSFYTSIYSCNFEHCNDVGLMFKINVHRSTYVW